MDAVLTLALKDLKLLIRHRISLFWIFVFPLLLALFFGFAFGGSGERARALPVAVVDNDDSPASRKLIERMKETNALAIEHHPRDEAEDAVRRGNLVAFVIIPKGYGERAGRFGRLDDRPTVEVGIDPARQAEKGYLQGILTQVLYSGLQDTFSDPKKMKEQVEQARQELKKVGEVPPWLDDLFKSLEKMPDNWQIPQGEGAAASPLQPANLAEVPVARSEEGPLSAYEITFPSSILWGVLGCVQTFVISIVNERVGGTFLRLKVSPLAWWQVLAGKALACFLACVAVSLVLLLLGHIIFGVRIEKPLHLALAIPSTAICFVGILMLLATFGKTVDGVAGMAWGILMPLAMLGGGMIPLMVMPNWMLTASHVSPVKWGIWTLEGAIWRPLSIAEMLPACGLLLAIGAICFTLGVRKLSWMES